MSNGPFTEAFTEAQAKYLKDHPEAANEPVVPVVQLILDQEAATAKDYADGKISKEEYDGFIAKSQEGLDHFRDDFKEMGKELNENFEDWAIGAKEEYETLKQDHPEVIQAMESGNVNVLQAADGAEFAVNVVEPLVDTVLDSVDVVLDRVDDSLSTAATGLVEARNSLPSVDEAERDANLARLDAATAELHDVMDKAHESIADTHDKVSEGFGQMRDGVDAMHDYGAEHPDAMLVETISDAPDVQEHVEEESDLADA